MTTFLFTVELPVEPSTSINNKIMAEFGRVFHRPFGISFRRRNDGSVWVSSNGHAGIGAKTRDKLAAIARSAINSQ